MAMAAGSFEKLHIYQKSRELTGQIYFVSKNSEFSKDFGLKDQIRRAAISVMSNIAEGYERGTKAELIQFLYIAKGSCGEVRAQLQICLDLNYIIEDEYRRVYSLAQQTSSMISNFIGYLMASDYSEKENRGKRQGEKKDKDVFKEFFKRHGVELPDYSE